MFTKQLSNHTRLQRVRRVRAKLSGTAERPRLAVFRGLRQISVQCIDDTTGQTLLTLSDKGLTGSPIERAKQLGAKVAEAAKAKRISTVVFDRAGYQYHGRVAALAEGARSAGLVF